MTNKINSSLHCLIPQDADWSNKLVSITVNWSNRSWKQVHCWLLGSRGAALVGAINAIFKDTPLYLIRGIGFAAGHASDGEFKKAGWRLLTDGGNAGLSFALGIMLGLGVIVGPLLLKHFASNIPSPPPPPSSKASNTQISSTSDSLQLGQARSDFVSLKKEIEKIRKTIATKKEKDSKIKSKEEKQSSETETVAKEFAPQKTDFLSELKNNPKFKKPKKHISIIKTEAVFQEPSELEKHKLKPVKKEEKITKIAIDKMDMVENPDKTVPPESIVKPVQSDSDTKTDFDLRSSKSIKQVITERKEEKKQTEELKKENQELSEENQSLKKEIEQISHLKNSLEILEKQNNTLNSKASKADKLRKQKHQSRKLIEKQNEQLQLLKSFFALPEILGKEQHSELTNLKDAMKKQNPQHKLEFLKKFIQDPKKLNETYPHLNKDIILSEYLELQAEYLTEHEEEEEEQTDSHHESVVSSTTPSSQPEVVVTLDFENLPEHTQAMFNREKDKNISTEIEAEKSEWE